MQIGKTTHYSRLKAILEYAGGKSYGSAEKLVESVVHRSPPNFVFHKEWSPKKKEMVGVCSENAVRNAVSLACDLGLLHSETGALTDAGAAAANPDRFDMVVRKHVKAHLESLGITISGIENACLEMLRKPRVVLPTADELYVNLCQDGRPCGFPRFRMLVRLFASCGGLHVSRRHIFLPVDHSTGSTRK